MKVLLAVDGSAYSDHAAQLIVSQFSREATEVRVLHVDEWPKDVPASLMFAEGAGAAAAILAAHDLRRTECAALVGRTVDQLKHAGFQSAGGVVCRGDARRAILDEATGWGADLIVLGSHGRTGLTRVLLGSVSDSVSRHASCSVVIVRDERRAA
jgi:nucleotide-binding universal stress UspA family protein